MSLKFDRTVDDIDWKLLSALESEARISFSELGRRVGLSQPAAAERVKRLESLGIIRGYRVDIDRTLLGYPISAFIRMDTEGERCRGFQQKVGQMNEVLECHRVTGEGSYIVRATVASIAELESLIDRLVPFGSPTTSIVLSSPLPPRNVRCGQTA